MNRLALAAVPLLAWLATAVSPVTAVAESAKLPQNKGFITIRDIMVANCAGCHAWATSYSGIASPTRIVATLPEKSLLYQKIENDSMPPSGKKLSKDEKALISAWLAAGAPPTDTPIVESTGLPQPCPCGLPQKPVSGADQQR